MRYFTEYIVRKKNLDFMAFFPTRTEQENSMNFNENEWNIWEYTQMQIG